jgi:glycosyltransferase involved in cell wall biosynthesis
MIFEPRTNLPNIHWAILTGEYPPQSGGVSDYTRLVAEGLASVGDEVSVYAPPQDIGPDLAVPGVHVHRLPDRFGLRGLCWLDHELARDRPDRILLQYVPHAFGFKAMNLPLAAWIAARSRRVTPVWVMFHEVAYPFVRRPLRHNLLAFVNRIMAHAIAGGADRVFVSIPSWAQLLSQVCPRAQPAEWLPVPCNVATTADPGAVAAAFSRYAPEPPASLVGHFGTFGRSITKLLGPCVVGLLRSEPLTRILFIGRGSERYLFDIVAAYPELAGRVSATGELSRAAAAAHLQACDLLLQPYGDGVSSRRTSVMAALANRIPVVTNLGALSEPLWSTSTGATVVAGPDPAKLAAASVAVLALPYDCRLALGRRGAELYFREFSVERTIARLRDPSSELVDKSHRKRAKAEPAWD